MRDLGILHSVISDDWFTSEPVRIVRFLHLLDAVDESGSITMSRAKFGKLFGTTAEGAFCFLLHLERCNIVTRKQHAKCTQITILNIDSYDVVTRKQHVNNTQNDIATREQHANYTQTTNSLSEDYGESTRELHANNTQTQRKENRKEIPSPPTPPITKEKNKEKKDPLTWGCAPDFVGTASTHEGARIVRTKTKDGKELTLVSKGRQVFEAYYFELYGEQYYWQAKDAAAMKRLLQKISFGRSSKANPLPTDDESLIKALDIFLRMINKAWIMNNFTVNKIDSQYNDIVAEIKNKNNGEKVNSSYERGRLNLKSQAADVINDIAKADMLYYRQKGAGDDAPK